MLFGCRSGDGNGNGDPPGTPQNFTAEPSRGQITLNWNTEPGVSYDLFHSRVRGMGIEGTGVMRISNVTPPYAHRELTDGTTYYYYLTANNSSGASEPTPEMSATTLPPEGAPETPGSFTATASGTTRGQITLNWDTEPGVSYDLFHSRVRGMGIEGMGVMRISNVTPPYEHTGLMDGTTYYYYLTANNSSGASAPTAEMSASTLPAPMPLAPPETPGSFTATPGSGKVTLNWMALPNLTYTLYHSTRAGIDVMSSTNIMGVLNVTPPYEHTGLANGTTYYYRLTARNAAGESPAASERSATPEEPKISAGNEHTCAVLADGRARCWGKGEHGRLGHNEMPEGEGERGVANKPSPTQVAGLTSGVTQISTGSSHTCALARGRALCWGEGNFGRLGNGGTSNAVSPQGVTGLTGRLTQIAAGNFHSCAVVDGGAWCWGSGFNGRLGNGSSDSVNVTTPARVMGLTSGVTQIATGSSHTCAVVEGGAMCWGSDAFGQLGNGDASHANTPQQVVGLTSGVTQISAGELHTCAVVKGAAWCWGDGTDGRLGHNEGDGNAEKQSPAEVDGLASGVTQIAAGDSHTCAMMEGRALCWGNGNNGRLGHNEIPQTMNGMTTGGPNASKPSPTQVQGLTSGVTQISIGGGGFHTCAVANGRVLCWGLGGDGRLGHNEMADVNADKSSPTPVDGL